MNGQESDRERKSKYDIPRSQSPPVARYRAVHHPSRIYRGFGRELLTLHNRDRAVGTKYSLMPVNRLKKMIKIIILSTVLIGPCALGL
jgi:hypothetical protein